MIQVQRFNKVLKLAVILGDLVILNVLFISFNSIWNELFGERACSGTLPQILTLFSLFSRTGISGFYTVSAQHGYLCKIGTQNTFCCHIP